jgi:cysteine desulfurase
MVDENTLMISIMQVNNEFGTIQDTDAIAKAVKTKNPKTIIHVDGVQGFGKHRINLKNIDLYSFSGHKIHAPKGIGGLYVKKGIRLKSIIYGGQQQGTVRPGTENTSGIAGLGTACEDAFSSIDERAERVKAVKECMAEIVNETDGIFINGDFENGSPYILSLDFKGIRGEVLVHALEKKDIYVSTGSACSTRSKKKPAVYYINPDSEGTVRFSFSGLNTVEEAQECKKALMEIVPTLRMYKRR